MLRVSIDPSKAEGIAETLVVTYTDEDISITMDVRNCIGVVSEGRAESPSAELRLPYGSMLDIVLGERSFEEVLAAGDAKVEGSMEKFQAIMGVCEMQL